MYLQRKLSTSVLVVEVCFTTLLELLTVLRIINVMHVYLDVCSSIAFSFSFCFFRIADVAYHNHMEWRIEHWFTPIPSRFPNYTYCQRINYGNDI